MRMYTKKMAGLRDRAARAAGALRAKAAGVDEHDQIHAALLELLWEAGFMTMLVPKQNGGGGVTMVEASVVVEELARGSGAAALAVILQALAASAIRLGATEKQASALFERMVDGRQTLAFALSEPEPAPGEKAAVTRAKRSGKGFSISGKKTFVSGAREADLVLVFAVTNPKAGLKKALSAFVVPAGTTGMLPGRELSKSGLRGVPAVELVFQGCAARASDRLGASGKGYEIANRAIVETCPLAAALACGLLAEIVEHSLPLARLHSGVGYPLSESQPVEMTLAEMAASLDSMRSLTWAAARAVDECVPEAERLAREAKWMATEAAADAAGRAVRLFGVEGAIRGSLLERLGRDARASQLVLGPNHIHRIEVARKLISAKK